jgi:hypothetical protein
MKHPLLFSAVAGFVLGCAHLAEAQPIPAQSLPPQATPVAAAFLTIPRQNRWQEVYDWAVTAGASAGFVLLFDGAKPADGVVTPLDCIPVAANARVYSTIRMPERYATSVTVVFSTTGCFTKTESATAFIKIVQQ